MPPDPAVISNVAKLAATCTVGGSNPCTDGAYHNAAPGVPQQAFAAGQADTTFGYSEQSLYIVSGGQPADGLTVVPLPTGPQANPPMLYSDTFVTNRSTCSTAPCVQDGEAFTALMTGAEMKTYIAFTQDFPGAPPRRLLTATRPFWEQPVVRQDPLYSQLNRHVAQGQTYANWFTPDNRTDISTKVCGALMAAGLKTFDCTPDTCPTMMDTHPVSVAATVKGDAP